MKVVERTGLFIAWVVVIVVCSVAEPTTFATGSNVSTILGSQTSLLILAIGLVVPLTVGEFDLSIAYNLVLSSLVLAWLNVDHGVNVVLACLAALVVGLAIGALNAAVIVGIGVDSFVATLGSGTVVGGLALWLSHSQTISGVSQGLVNVMVVGRFLGIPLEFFYGIVLVAIVWVLYRFTALGQRLLFVGHSRETARLSGIRVSATRAGALVAAGGAAGLAAVVSAGHSGAADPTANVSLLLPAFAAAFLGSTTITPGRFNAWGTAASVYFLASGITGLQLAGAGTFVQDLFYGGALVVAVALSVTAKRHRQHQANRRGLAAGRSDLGEHVEGPPVDGIESRIES